MIWGGYVYTDIPPVATPLYVTSYVVVIEPKVLRSRIVGKLRILVDEMTKATRV